MRWRQKGDWREEETRVIIPVNENRRPDKSGEEGGCIFSAEVPWLLKVQTAWGVLGGEEKTKRELGLKWR